ncbi:cytochrome P450 [Lophium mytilinum]|uniref:Cytochrome P450 n=1 Tax=Lophium mytilinum TaxID=390894 RepID=A0A6A6Q8N2_9PEZI|nr:cytochrome P450 [Lophium mytilinum]
MTFHIPLWETTVLLLLGAVIVWPVFNYFRDRKRLRRFPAPSVAGFTNIWMMYQQYNHNRVLATHDAHQKLGKAVRVGPNHLSFISRQAVKDIYGHGTAAQKDKFYISFTGTHESSLDSTDRQAHGEKRKRLAAAFAQKRVSDMEYLVSDDVQKLVNRFDEAILNDKVINVRWYINMLLFDLTGHLVFSQSLGCVERGDDMMVAQKLDGTKYETKPANALRNSLRIGSTMGWAPSLFQLNKRLTWWHPGWKGGADFNSIVLHMVRTRLEKEQQGAELNDFFKSLVWTKDGGPLGLEIGEMVAECALLLNAGSDTTTIVLVGTMFLLTKWPDAAKKLREELDMALGDDFDGVPAFDSVKNLPYLRACVDEAMRMRPPLRGGLPRVTPKEGMQIDGEWIAGNTTVSVPTYSLHHDADLFKDPWTYRPERWLEENAAELQSVFIPFSAGGRGCIGRNVSYLELLVVVSTLMRRYDFEFEAGPGFELETKDTVNAHPGPMMMKLKRRKFGMDLEKVDSATA